MGTPVRIVDVAKRLIAESHSDISIEYTGLREGEKLHEVLLSDLEVAEPSSHERITRVVIEGMDPGIIEDMDPRTQMTLPVDREHQTH
jgi:dTDP-glucose 4,6-dehydratase